jgi:hypothetical protein
MFSTARSWKKSECSHERTKETYRKSINRILKCLHEGLPGWEEISVRKVWTGEEVWGVEFNWTKWARAPRCCHTKSNSWRNFPIVKWQIKDLQWSYVGLPGMYLTQAPQQPHGPAWGSQIDPGGHDVAFNFVRHTWKLGSHLEGQEWSQAADCRYRFPSAAADGGEATSSMKT